MCVGMELTHWDNDLNFWQILYCLNYKLYICGEVDLHF